MEIIPAIDIIDGKCVRLTQGDYAQKKEYHSNPLEVAKKYEDHGIRRLHLVDLDGAKAKKVINYQVLGQITRHTSLKVDFGGGVQSDADLKIVFEMGAQQVTGGSIAVRKPEIFMQWLQTYGAEKVILGADAKDRKIAISGWQESTTQDVLEFIKDYHQKGVQYVICTDVAKDGVMEGPSIALYKEILAITPKVKLIASGGVSGIEDLHQLKSIGVYGVIIGKAIYEGKINLEELKPFL
ncbi:1-(5-phosphoribosyl)-5-[(5-phosphoribosylamino)methylideneamino]imidazole-4-carboxamide isomerase [Catalinimonas niigatensis]|uniref:1-(5-phosphoribosyl)-5-[(5- phosphoribosylamino)methylideneamino]imidazole-4- carboxamide isomerase n=1 Tax=Catalinimonas niigatensis TaxID=1397264 RepID=UPI002666B792|nr:1-(5-phosphoribosyl)-5-[(5-phosphoribosylamino)methylideneamino]imidazole-4-carboxamide isomerase [Catalinimonas niigatensis]WPP51097.1 1-(5-phosphoribosyl)-5-[(5-phosphoribosylamino)methylideneamino]imidazole-4-carboxamide isomerase [Catalinimonas niigatensis]